MRIINYLFRVKAEVVKLVNTPGSGSGELKLLRVRVPPSAPFKMLLGVIKKVKILFVCTGNTCRSPMAESYLSYLIAINSKSRLLVDTTGIFTIDSAGISANEGDSLSKHAETVLQKYNCTKKEHKSKNINQELMETADLILTMTEKHKNILLKEYSCCEKKIFNLREYAEDNSQDIFDPYGGTVEDYEKAFLLIKDALDKIYKKLIKY